MTEFLNYLVDVLIQTGMQLVLVFGPMLLLAFLMNFIAGFNENLSYRIMGQKAYLYTFGWLGTAVHELGHAFFALLFLHKITDIQLFSPKGHGGSLGYVAHSYNKKNIYHRIGNFFIGLGPILFGSLVLFFSAYFLFHIKFDLFAAFKIDKGTFSSLTSFEIAFKELVKIQLEILRNVFYGHNSNWWKLLIFIYLIFSVGSSVTLSKSDVSASVGGFAFFVGVLLLFNLATVWYSPISARFFAFISPALSIICILIVFAMVFNVLFSLILLLTHFIKTLLMGK